MKTEKLNFPKSDSLVIWCYFDRETRRKRISERLKLRLEAGMVNEVKHLLIKGFST